MIKSINWMITGQCNGRCVHCDIWRGKNGGTNSSLKDIGRILSDKVIKQGYEKYGREYDISFAGGEPFLRDDLQEVVDLVETKYPGSFKSITTNGLLGDRILDFVKRNRRLGFKLNVSIDGVEGAHDALRGKGAFRKTVRTVHRIRKRFSEQRIGIKFTLSPYNYDQITKVYALALKWGCQFSFKPVEDLRNYTNSRKPFKAEFTQDQLCVVRNQCFRLADLMYRTRDYRRARFYKDIPFYLAKKKMPSSCSVINDYLTIMPDGKCFFCLKGPLVGCVPRMPLSKIKEVSYSRRLECRSCMLLCGAYKDYTHIPFERVVANIETISRCNLDCDICTQQELRAEKAQEMSLGLFKQLIEKNSKIEHVSFIGGEPFLNRFFVDMMEHLDTKAITYEITTNGTLINEDMITRLKGCIGLKSLLFSLDGQKAYHDRERGRGVFSKCIKSLILMKDFVQVGVCSVLKADNCQEILELSRFLGDRGIRDHRIIYGMSLSSQSRECSLALMPELASQGPCFDGQADDDGELMEFFQLLESMAGEKGIKITYVPKLMRTRTKMFLAGDWAKLGSICCRQLSQLRFNPAGKRIICEFIRNEYDFHLAEKLKNEFLPVCEKCCKLIECT